MCEFAYYKDNEKDFPQLYCHLKDNQDGFGFCLYRKRCDNARKFILIDEWKECGLMVEQKEQDVPKGAYSVKTYIKSRSGKIYLYVKYGKYDIKIESPNNQVLDYVYIKETKNGYIGSVEPFVANNKRKKNETKKTN